MPKPCTYDSCQLHRVRIVSESGGSLVSYPETVLTEGQRAGSISKLQHLEDCAGLHQGCSHTPLTQALQRLTPHC